MHHTTQSLASDRHTWPYCCADGPRNLNPLLEIQLSTKEERCEDLEVRKMVRAKEIFFKENYYYFSLFGI